MTWKRALVVVVVQLVAFGVYIAAVEARRDYVSGPCEGGLFAGTDISTTDWSARDTLR